MKIVILISKDLPQLTEHGKKTAQALIDPEGALRWELAGEDLVDTTSASPVTGIASRTEGLGVGVLVLGAMTEGSSLLWYVQYSNNSSIWENGHLKRPGRQSLTMHLANDVSSGITRRFQPNLELYPKQTRAGPARVVAGSPDSRQAVDRAEFSDRRRLGQRY